MYRASHDTFASTIERLEAELRELRALRAPARPRERYLWTVTVASVLGMVLAIGACVAARARTEDAERRFDGARARLEVKTQDLGACETLASRALHGAED